MRAPLTFGLQVVHFTVNLLLSDVAGDLPDNMHDFEGILQFQFLVASIQIFP